jgi:hypothetical protein
LQNLKDTIAKIASLKEGDIDSLTELDSMGLFPAPDETTVEAFKKRLNKLFEHLNEIKSELDKKGTLKLFDWLVLDKERQIPSEIMEEATLINEKHYGFKIDWVPGFFLSRNLGFLWGGCAISLPEDHLSIFLIRANFAEKKRWLIYRRDELLSHELCHIARLPVGDRSFEELFAYRLSPSGFRRYMGNCFQYSIDAVLFIIPFFLLLAAQASQQFLNLTWLPIYPFWILVSIYPLFLMIRNQLIRNTFFKAKRNLEKSGIKNAPAILFRSTKQEIGEIAAQKTDLQKYLKDKSETELRWKIIYRRFMG